MSKEISCVLIDDEQHAIETLEWELEKCDFPIKIMSTFQDPKEGRDFLNTTQPDLVFLDIEMPFLNGFELLNQLDSINFHIVFTTAYDKFALNAFKVSALDYLLKPVDRDDLNKVLEKVLEIKRKKDITSQIEILSQRLKGEFSKVALPTLKGLEFIEIENIVRCSAESNYTHIYLANGKKILISKTLKQVEEILKEGTFFRVHSSSLINLKMIKQYIKGDGGQVVLEDGSVVDVARSKKKDFLQIFR